MAASRAERLAVDGGPKACKTPWQPRGLFGAEEKAAAVALFDRCIETGGVFGYNGPEEEAYCSEFAAWLGGGFADAVNSGTTAVYVALRALEPKAFTEVIVPPITDPGGVMPVPLCACVPVPADAAPDSFNAGPEQIEARITPRTSAIIVAHIAGIPADMGPIMEIAKARGIPVIEDCAQAHGATYRGRMVGTFGDIGAFSTMSGKHHATGAQGGVVFTKREDLYWRARRYSDRGKPFGVTGNRGNVVCSLNYNLNDLAACIGRVQLKKLPRIVAARRKAALALTAACKKELKAVRIAEAPARAEASYWFLFGRLDLARLTVDKAAFVKALQAEGVSCGVSYRHVFTEQDWYRNRAVFPGTGYPWTSPLYKGNPDQTYPLPNLDVADARTFNMAWHERVRSANVREIVKALKKVEAAYLKR